MSHPFLTMLQAQGLAVASQAPLPGDGTVPEWIMVMPGGTVRGVDGRGPWTMADPQPVITASVVPGRPIPADFNHQTVFAVTHGGQSPAAGWIEQMEARDGDIWAKVDWTQEGRQAVASKQYRYVSPTFRFDNKSGAVRVITSVALVNNPNFTELPAIASQVGQGDPMEELLKALRQALGLADDANQDAILQACRGGTATASALTPLAADLGLGTNSSATDIVTIARGKLAATVGTPDPSKFVPMAAFTELQSRVAELTTASAKSTADKAVDEAMRAGKVSPALKDWALGYASKDPAGFGAWAAAAPAIVTPGGVQTPTGTPPGAGRGDLPEESVLAVCAQLGIDPAAYREFLKKEKGQ